MKMVQIEIENDSEEIQVVPIPRITKNINVTKMSGIEEQGECLTSLNLRKFNKTPLNLTFQNLSYSVSVKNNKALKTLFEDVSGKFESGRLTAILGPSGAGKSSLVKVLAGFRTKGVMGNVYVNNKPRDIDDFIWKSCYISQETSMLPDLTVKETLKIAADLKLPTKVSKSQKLIIIQEIAEILGLVKSMDTRVSNISGGEMKRLSIGVELVTNPPIMFFDEPTSGLDSVSSALVVSHMRELASGGRTIICVIHQPSSRIFDMFDDVLLLSEGRCLYYGPVKEMVSCLKLAGFNCPQYYNRADFAIEVATNEITGDRDTLIVQTAARFDDNVKIPVNNNIGDNRLNGFDSKIATAVYKLTGNISRNKRHAISEWTQFKLLFMRSSLCIYRNIHIGKIKLAAHVIFGLMIGLLYYNFGNEASKITSNAAFLFFIILFIYFGNGMPAVVTFPVEAPVFIREMRNNWYSLKAYYFSKMLSDLPLQFLCPTTFFVIVYIMTGQPMECFRIVMVWSVCFAFTFIAHLLGLITGVLFELQLGMFCLPAFTIPMIVFSGFFIRYREIPVYFMPLSYISYFRYGFEGMMVAILGYDRPNLHCSEPFCFYKNPKKFLQEMDMPERDFYIDIGCLALWVLVLQITLYIILKYKLWKGRQ